MNLHAFLSDTLADRNIDDREVFAIRQEMLADGSLNLEDVKLLIELYCNAGSYGASFEELVFDVLERVLLADGQVDQAEQFYLLKLLYSDRRVRPCERDFLRRLQAKVATRSPQFDALCRDALAAADTNWDVGGR